MSSSILTNWLENSTGRYFAPKTFDTLVFMQSASQTQGKLVDLPTYFQEAVFNREIKIDLSHNNTCAFGSMEDGSWPGVTGILGTANGGTGNADGYIRTGALNNSSIGNRTTIEGYLNVGSGARSYVGGVQSEASGSMSFAFGYQTIAEQTNSIALGDNVIANGSHSIALGYNGKTSILICGSGTSYTFYKTGTRSAIRSSIGLFDSSTGTINLANTSYRTYIFRLESGIRYEFDWSSLSLPMYFYTSYNGTTLSNLITTGRYTSYTANSIQYMVVSIALNSTITVRETFSFTPAIGSYVMLTDVVGHSKITEIGSTCTVDKVLSSSYLNYAPGYYKTSNATSSYAVAIGYSPRATNSYAVAIGQQVQATGLTALALGYNTKAQGARSMAANIGTTASGDYATSFGYYTTAAGDSSFVIGKYNITDTDNTYAFIIGNGTSVAAANKSNAFTVDWDGNAFISNNLSVGGSVTITGNIVPETDGYMVGTTSQPWTDVIAWNIGADDITSAFGGLRIANGTTQIELVQNDKITLTSSQVDLNCNAITLSNANYGYELPETGIEGQVFFLLLEE